MEIIYGYPHEGFTLKNNYIALGNFDGVHNGHRKIINTMVKEAQKSAARSVVITFEPHPKKILEPNNCPKLLTTTQTKARLISELKVDVLVLCPFNKAIANLSSREFIEKILVKFFKPTVVYVGYNYSFGSSGIGTPELLKEYGKRFGFEVRIIPPVYWENKPISSTLIRNLLSRGDITLAKKCLGYWPFIEGKVVPGGRLGRNLGFPTANLFVSNNILLPSKGVYAGLVEVDAEIYSGIANIGVKPTVSNEEKIQVEVHLIDFKGNLYGKEIVFSLRRRIRDEIKFNTVKELKDQIEKDIAYVRGLDLIY